MVRFAQVYLIHLMNDEQSWDLLPKPADLACESAWWLLWSLLLSSFAIYFSIVLSLKADKLTFVCFVVQSDNRLSQQWSVVCA